MRTVLFAAIALAGGIVGGQLGTPRTVAADRQELDPVNQFGKGYSLTDSSDASGLWVKTGSPANPAAALFSQRFGGKFAVLGFNRGGKEGKPHDFAIVAERDSVWFQVIDEKGGFHTIPVTALLKLEK